MGLNLALVASCFMFGVYACVDGVVCVVVVGGCDLRVGYFLVFAWFTWLSWFLFCLVAGGLLVDLFAGGLMLGVDWFVVGCNWCCALPGVLVAFSCLCWLRLITSLFVVYSWFGLMLVVLECC